LRILFKTSIVAIPEGNRNCFSFSVSINFFIPEVVLLLLFFSIVYVIPGRDPESTRGQDVRDGLFGVEWVQAAAGYGDPALLH